MRIFNVIFYIILFIIFYGIFFLLTNKCFAQDSDYICAHPFSCTVNNNAISNAQQAAYIQSGVKTQLDNTTLAIERKAKSYIPNDIVPIITTIGIGYKTYKSKSIKIPMGNTELRLNINSVGVTIKFL